MRENLQPRLRAAGLKQTDVLRALADLCPAHVPAAKTLSAAVRGKVTGTGTATLRAFVLALLAMSDRKRARFISTTSCPRSPDRP